MRLRSTATAVASTLTVIGAALPAHAQQTSATEAAPMRVEVVGTAAAYDPRRDDTASKIVVTHDDIVKYGDTSVVDALKRVPGVTVSGTGRSSEVRMRGLGNGYTQILIDGERAPANFSIDSLSPEVIERIEVLRVASAEFSTQAIAGTINIVLKKAVKAGQRSFKLGYAYGAALASPDGSLQLSDRKGQLSYSVAASASHKHTELPSSTLDRQFDAAGNLVGVHPSDGSDTERNTAINITPRVTWTFDSGDTLTSQTFLNFSQYDERVADSIGTTLGQLPDYPLVGVARQSTWRTLREELNWVHKLGDGVKLDTKLSALYTNITGDERRDGAGNPLAAALHESVPADGQDHGLTTIGKLSSTAHAGHTLAFGWDAGRSTRAATRREFDYLRPDAPLIEDDRYGIEISRLALYVQDEWNITPNWSTYVGARWEGILIRTDGNTFDTAHSRSKVWSPLFQTLYKLPGTKGDQLRFAVSRTYKAPNLFDLLPLHFNSSNNTQTNPDIVGNARLTPELAQGFDAGYEHYWGQGGLLSASVSQRDIRDLSRKVLTFEDGRWLSSPINSGRARTRGLELEAKLPLKALIETSVALDMRASVSRNWSTVDVVPGPDNRLDSQTPVSATLGADYTKGAVTFGGTYVFKNGGPVRVLANQVTYQSVRRDLDVYALWQIDPRLQLRVAGANLLAQDRVAAGDFVFPDDGSDSTRTITPSHRSLRVTMQAKF